MNKIKQKWEKLSALSVFYVSIPILIFSLPVLYICNKVLVLLVLYYMYWFYHNYWFAKFQQFSIKGTVRSQCQKIALVNFITVMYFQLQRVSHKKVDKAKNWLLMKNSQFWSNHADISGLLCTHLVVISTKFHKGGAKFVDFFSKAIFWSCPLFYGTPSMYWSY